jgi:hypothetical protein
MIYSTPEILFYVVRNPMHLNDSYSVFNIITDRLIMDRVKAEEVRDFLLRNNPVHPMIRDLSRETHPTLDDYISIHNLSGISQDDSYLGAYYSSIDDCDHYNINYNGIEDADPIESTSPYTDLNNIPYISGSKTDQY